MTIPGDGALIVKPASTLWMIPTWFFCLSSSAETSRIFWRACSLFVL